MADILKQEEINILLDVCDNRTDLEKLQALRNLLGETPVKGTVTSPYIKLSVGLATDIITQLSKIITKELQDD